MLTDTSDWGTGVGALDFWAARNGCATRRSERSSAFSDVTIDAWTDCDRGADVQLLTLGEWGHRWPGPHFTLGVEPDSGLYGFDASEIIWEFFRNYERSAQYVRASL